MGDNGNADGPVIRWDDYGYEGWKPYSYATLTEALADDRHGSRFVLTRRVDYVVAERLDPDPSGPRAGIEEALHLATPKA